MPAGRGHRGEIRRLTEYVARIRSDDRLLTIGLAPEAPLEWLDMLDDNEPSAEPFKRPDLLSAHFQINATNVGLIIQAADPSRRDRKAGRVQEWAVPFVPIDTLSQHLDLAAPRKGRAP